LNELQKAHHKYETQTLEIAAQQSELMALKTAQRAEIKALKSELAALKQSQQQQLTALAKLSAQVQACPNRTLAQTAASIQR